MSYSDFSDDSLEQLKVLNSKNKIHYVNKKTTYYNNWQMFECCDLMTVPLYSGPIFLQDLKRIEVNGNKIFELNNKRLSTTNKRKNLSNNTNKSKVNI